VFNVEMGYFMVLQVRLGAKIGDLYAKDFNSFCNKLKIGRLSCMAHPFAHTNTKISPILIINCSTKMGDPLALLS